MFLNNKGLFIVCIHCFTFSSVGPTMYKGSIVILKKYMLSFQRKYLFLSLLGPKSGLKNNACLYVVVIV